MNKKIEKECERYKVIFELSPEAIALLNFKGETIDVNGRVYDWLGYKREEIIGKEIKNLPFLDEKGKSVIKENFQRRARGEKPSPYDVDFFTKQGKKLIGRVVGSVVRDSNENPAAIIVMISDVTNEREMARRVNESEERLKKVIAYSPDAITITNLEGKIIDCNRATLDLHGFSKKEEIIGRSSLDLISPKDRQKAAENIKKTISSGFVKGVEYSFINKDGKEFPAELSASLIRDAAGKPAFFMGLTRDISERKKIERAKAEFISLASHQLRNPLAAINWYSEMLLSTARSHLSKKQKNYIEEIFSSNQRLMELADLFLNTSKIELGVFGTRAKRINITEMADDALNQFSIQIKDKNIKVEKNYKKSLIAHADPDIINVVFQNLFSNAVQYTPDGGTVKVSVERKNPDVIITISDTGYGIPGYQQPQIFSKFFRADNVKEKNLKGTGLGLYIVKSVLGKIGGNIWFESEEKKGTTFYVKIPAKGLEKHIFRQ